MEEFSLNNNDHKIYSKYQGYERIYLRISLVFLVVSAILYYFQNIFFVTPSFITNPDQRPLLIWNVIITIVIFVLHHLRCILFKIGMLEKRAYYYFEKILLLITISFVIHYTNIGLWFYPGILLPVIFVFLVKGIKPGYVLLISSMAIHLILFLYKNIAFIFETGTKNADFTAKLAEIIIFYVMFFVAALLFGQIYKCSIEYEIENKSIVEQFEERCMKLESSRDEIKTQYESLTSNAGKLEESNKELSKSIAEFYTLHQISQTIGSVLETKELLKRLNDIILGVMGVSYSTIILYDENINRLKVHTTNISNINDLATMTDNINCGILMETLNKGQSILENNVDYMQYIFTCGRDINSLICIPLTTSTRKYGMVLVEHTYANAFDEDNVRLLSIIAQQVGIVMENAELYYKMRELARKDGLTGIYNRQYFQERLDIEFKNAKQENYPLSLAIFDIDHFKRFNDTHGHMFGDKVLTSIVKAVKATLRKNDMMARYGGEEFIILLPRTNLSEAYEKVDALRKMISKYSIEDGLINVSITASFGISSFDECVLNENELVRTADDALYAAKAAGRNCVMVSRKLIE